MNFVFTMGESMVFKLYPNKDVKKKSRDFVQLYANKFENPGKMINF